MKRKDGKRRKGRRKEEEVCEEEEVRGKGQKMMKKRGREMSRKTKRNRGWKGGNGGENEGGRDGIEPNLRLETSDRDGKRGENAENLRESEENVTQFGVCCSSDTRDVVLLCTLFFVVYDTAKIQIPTLV